MNLYLIEIDDGEADWDSNIGHVIACRSEQEARKMASEVAADEGSQIWLDEELAKIEQVGWNASTKPKIILTSFKAG